MMVKISREYFRSGIFCLALIGAVSVRSDAQRPQADQAYAAGIRAEYRNGQTFLTWIDADTSAVKSYRILRHTAPITDENCKEAKPIGGPVEHGSGIDYIHYATHGLVRGFRITDLGEELPPGAGLYVHTVTKDELAYYAVASFDGSGRLVPRFEPGRNSLSEPVRERPGEARPVLTERLRTETGLAEVYTHWVGEDMHPRENMAFRFAVAHSVEYDPASRPAMLIYLHGAGGRYRTDHNSGDGWITLYPEMRTVTFTSEKYRNWSGRGSTFWFGLNSNFYDEDDPYGGINVNYTERRLLWTIRWVMGRYNVDPDRVHIEGNSMGGYGTLNMALRYPELFASAMAWVPNMDFHRMSDYANGIGELHWGPRADNIRTSEGTGVFDRADLTRFAREHPEIDFPVIMTMNGKGDQLVGWETVRLFYAAMQESNHALMAFWSRGPHGGPQRPEFGTPSQYYELDIKRLRRDQSYPAIANATTNAAPGTSPDDGDPVGQLNGTFAWRDIIDRPLEYGITIEPLNGRDLTAAADITPRRLQRFMVTAGWKYDYENIELNSGKVLQRGTIAPDAHGLLTVKAFRIGPGGDRLRITPAK